jgi:tRNA 2-thiouridine synthesizing protein A
MSSDVDVDEVVDARDLMCPMPVLAATKAMRRLEPNQVIKVLATDRGSLSDIPAWAEDNGHELVSQESDGDVLVFVVRKSDDG